MTAKGDGGRAPKDAKAERLAAALRENLRKRKAQARGRKAGESARPEPSGEKRDGPESGH